MDARCQIVHRTAVCLAVDGEDIDSLELEPFVTEAERPFNQALDATCRAHPMMDLALLKVVLLEFFTSFGWRQDLKCPVYRWDQRSPSLFN